MVSLVGHLKKRRAAKSKNQTKICHNKAIQVEYDCNNLYDLFLQYTGLYFVFSVLMGHEG